MTNTLQYPLPSTYQEVSKAQSTDDQCSYEQKAHNVYKTNLCKYKTQMCKNYSEMGYCPYRIRCQFAHGFQELTNSMPTAKKAYRTKKCKSFWEAGICRYGFRCQFQHYESDMEKQRGFLKNCENMLQRNNQLGYSGSKLAKILIDHPTKTH